MKLPSINCPRCNHPQKFGRRKRINDDGDTEIFIKCRMCRWEKVVLVGSDDMINDHRQIQRLKVRAEKDPSLKKVVLKKIAKRKSVGKRRSDT